MHFESQVYLVYLRIKCPMCKTTANLQSFRTRFVTGNPRRRHEGLDLFANHHRKYLQNEFSATLTVVCSLITFDSSFLDNSLALYRRGRPIVRVHLRRTVSLLQHRLQIVLYMRMERKYPGQEQLHMSHRHPFQPYDPEVRHFLHLRGQLL